MELVHRVLWQTDDPVLLSDARESLKISSDPRTLSERSIVSDDLKAHELRLQPSPEFKIILRIADELGKQYLWIDAEAVSHDQKAPFLEIVGTLSQNLIRKSLSSSHRPYLDDMFIDADLANSRKEGVIEYFVKSLFARNRSIAMIVVAYDPMLEDETPTILTAKSLLRDFSGVAMVLYLQRGSLGRFQAMVGANYDLEPGQIRVYPPNEIEEGTVIAAPAITAQEISTNDYLSIQRQVLRILQPYLLARSLPENCAKALRVLRETSEPVPENEERISGGNIIEILEKENEELRKELLSRSREIEDYREETAKLQEELIESEQTRRDAEEWWVQYASDLEAQREMIEEMAVRHALTRSVREAAREYSANISSVAEALDKGREILHHHLEIPPNVSHQLEKMDQSHRKQSWGRSIFQAFLALSAYAEEGGFLNFYDWNKEGKPFAIPVRDVAMRESDNVRQRPYLYNQRVLSISVEIEDSGKVFMESHIKFHGPLAPRMYFYDDTKGATRKVHIGGIDPHNRWENTTT